MIKRIFKHWLIFGIFALGLLTITITHHGSIWYASGLSGIIPAYGIPLGMILGIILVNRKK